MKCYNYYFLSVDWGRGKTSYILSISKDVEQWVLSHSTEGINWYNHFGEQFGISYKSEHIHTL